MLFKTKQIDMAPGKKNKNKKKISECFRVEKTKGGPLLMQDHLQPVMQGHVSLSFD